MSVARRRLATIFLASLLRLLDEPRSLLLLLGKGEDRVGVGDEAHELSAEPLLVDSGEPEMVHAQSDQYLLGGSHSVLQIHAQHTLSTCTPSAARFMGHVERVCWMVWGVERVCPSGLPQHGAHLLAQYLFDFFLDICLDRWVNGWMGGWMGGSP